MNPLFIQLSLYLLVSNFSMPGSLCKVAGNRQIFRKTLLAVSQSLNASLHNTKQNKRLDSYSDYYFVSFTANNLNHGIIFK